MRNESVDMTEFTRRIDRGIYDHEEFERALKWVKENVKEGFDHNREDLVLSREEKDKQWEFVIKMFLIGRDLMIGNPRLAELGFEEEAVGHYALVGGFQGQRQWTDHFPNGDFMETFLNTQFDWNGIRRPYIFATENDALNGVSMLFNYLLTNTPQIFADVRTYWSPEAVERVTGHKLEGHAENGFLHLINSGSCTLDGTGQATRNGEPVMKPFWELDQSEVDAMLAIQTSPQQTENTSVVAVTQLASYLKEYACNNGSLELIEGVGPVLQSQKDTLLNYLKMYIIHWITVQIQAGQQLGLLLA